MSETNVFQLSQPRACADPLLVRDGHLPKREIVTGIGPVAVRCPRVRDRVGKGDASAFRQ